MSLPGLPSSFAPIQPVKPIADLGAPSVKGAPPNGGFQAAFQNAVLRVNEFQQAAKDSAGRFLAGEGEELHQVVLAQQRAELEFELFLQVRNKAVQAYQEIMRMQL